MFKRARTQRKNDAVTFEPPTLVTASTRSALVPPKDKIVTLVPPWHKCHLYIKLQPPIQNIANQT
jgi:hypothetical protein